MLLRGARQIGKTWSIREFGKSYKNYCEINFEEDKSYKELFANSIDPFQLVENISAVTGISILETETLLFFDEIQACPDALRSLRFFMKKCQTSTLLRQVLCWNLPLVKFLPLEWGEFSLYSCTP